MKMRSFGAVFLAGAVLLGYSPVSAQPAKSSVYDFHVETIDGEQKSLSEYKGKTLLIVNTASKCGYTPQYKTLEELYQKFKGRGFVVLGFPANNFMGQEPGTNAQIKEFCQLKYKVSFPMFAKISVKGDDIHPLYRFLTAQPNVAGDITWNFNKFLIGPDGAVAARFDKGVDPMSEEVISGVEANLSPAIAATDSSKDVQQSTNTEADMIAVLETNRGNIEIKLFKDIAPKTVENFVGLINKGYYNGIVFHRVIPEFMIQGGDPTGTGRGGESLWGGKFEDEFKPTVKFDKKGILAMANAGPNTNGSQFFITTAPTPWLNMHHTIFGEVVSGYENVEAIERTQTGPGDRPVQEQKIIKAYMKAAQ